ncbi:MAG: bifunctional acetate--CoA ligase family protein/GNAT family N-acetyltransferase [Rubrivivax sp.]|nr:bifunctional acetate--CoA ligase family protein/GNAT family N-acetyltransferase [Rubrivivax sp.]
MSIRHLDSLFDPRSVAVVGATDRAGSVGATVWQNLRSGGFTGPLWPVNPGRRSVGGEPAFADVALLPAAPELAVVCTPPAAVAGVIAALGAKGTRAAVVLTAGQTPEQKQAMLNAARQHTLRILGPNCLGLLSPHAKLNASFAHTTAAAGSLAFVSQSGALVTAMLDWAGGRGIGFSHCVSLGEHGDVDFGDMLDWLASDARTRAVLLYIESIEAPRKFMSAARAAARNKPVLVVKAGRSPQGQAAAASHTGALAGSDLVYDAAMRRAGMLRVDTLQELFDAAETLSHFRGRLPSGTAWQQLTLVTNGGGAGVMAADAAAHAGVPLAALSDLTLQQLNTVLPPNWSHANPIDIIGDAPSQRYVDTLQALLAAPDTGTVLFMHAPTAIVPSADIAQALLPVMQAHPGRTLACWLGDAAVRPARQAFQAAGVPCHDTPEDAVRAFSRLVTYQQNQAQLLEAPPARSSGPAIDLAAVRHQVDEVLASGREWLNEPEAKQLLATCGIPVVGAQVVGADTEAAVSAARAIGYPVVIKLLSPQITHKSDVGGVALDLQNDDAVRHAASTMLERVARLRPDATLSGFTVQSMVQRPQALELIVGASIDSLFGPVMLFGHGGTSVEVVADRALALPPLNAPLARALIARTRIARLLQGWRDVPAADMDAVVQTLTAVSELLAAEPRIAEIDINPLLADAQGVIALDARVRVSAAGPGGAAHFAILPYPTELVEQQDWQGQMLTLRPIRPEDEAQHLAFLEKLDPADIRLRVFYSRRSIERTELARLTQIDYEREMAFVATVPLPGGGEETLGVARAVADPDNITAEFGVIVRSDILGGGLGRRLMHKLIGHFRQRGTLRMVGQILRENSRMLHLAQKLGFKVMPQALGDDTQEVVLELQAPGA